MKRRFRTNRFNARLAHDWHARSKTVKAQDLNKLDDYLLPVSGHRNMVAMLYICQFLK
jgi:hypothetical protein